MNGKNRNSNKSLFENSMKMAVNMVKLSSFSIAKMSLGAAGPFAATKDFEPMTGSMVVADEPLLSAVPQSQRSEKQWSGSKPRKFVMEPGGRNESAYVVQEENKGRKESSKGIDDENNVIDGRAAEYIEKVHKKNRDNFYETSILSPDIIPPPPLRALMMEPPKSLSY